MLDISLTPLFPMILLLAACNGEPSAYEPRDATDAPADALPALPPRVKRDGMGATREVVPFAEAMIVFTGEVRGEIETCGCPTVPYGGFGRRVRQLDKLRTQGVPMFIVDAGEMLVKGLQATDVDRSERAHAVLDLSLATGLDAWAASPIDLGVAGMPLLARSGALSANWRTAQGDAPLSAARIVERDGVHIGFIGVSAAADGLEAVDAVDSVKTAMQGDADTWIVLSNGPHADAIAAGVPGLGAVLSTRGEQTDTPRESAGAPVIETPDRGRYVTLLRVALAAVPGPWEIVEGGPWAELAQARAVEAAQGPTRVAALREKVAAATAGHVVVTVEDRPLGSDLDGPSAVDARIALFKANTKAAAKVRTKESPQATRYVSGGACVRCHSDRFAAWGFSPHAKAYEALQKRGQADDPECVGCHTTAWGEPGGNAEVTVEAMRTWKAVQCEACHGPRSDHPAEREHTPPVITAATCTGCHDAANSPSFDYATYVRRISCASFAPPGSTGNP